MKFLFALIILLSSCSSSVIDRDKLIKEIMITSGHMIQIERNIDFSKKEFLRIYPNLTENIDLPPVL